MRKLLFSVCLLVVIAILSILHEPHVGIHNKSTAGVQNDEALNNTVSKLHPRSFLQLQELQSFARQVQAPNPPLEERKQFSWWWWAIGVIVAIAGGMLLYVLIKKDPRKDAQ